MIFDFFIDLVNHDYVSKYIGVPLAILLLVINEFRHKKWQSETVFISLKQLKA